MPFTPTDYRPYDFANRRHIGPSPSEMAEMLDVLGVGSLDELIDQTVPASLRQDKPLGVKGMGVLRFIRSGRYRRLRP